MLRDDTAVRERAVSEPGAHGGTRENWTNPYLLDLEGVLLRAATSDEVDGRSGVTHIMYAALTADVEARDRIRYTNPRGKRRVYEVDGEPLWFNGPSPLTRYIKVSLKATDL
ncbi:hypothetical protein RCH12_002778 [Cryobacterium sp. MP_3.1]|uniref:hypothetical protein n=1 Tax=Cryobacterium sp. MP_3.1 TaxID=3071711 RepID=UPI002E0BF4A8|nr:hypothetical protein [Cryobacterium sp. MP_3.1]